MAIAETLIASTVLPAVIDFVKGLSSGLSRKFFGMSVDDQLKIANSDIDRLKALAELDNPHGTPSQWVVDLRGSFRYIGAIVVIAVGAWALNYGFDSKDSIVIDVGSQLVSIPFGFIFGERLLLGLKGSGRK